MATKKKFSESRVACIDTETTNLGDDARIIEFGFSVWENGQPVSKSSLLIHPGFEISEQVTEITGITNEDLEGKDSFATLFPIINNILNDCDVWMFYNAPFDVKMLKREYNLLGKDLPDKPVIDVLVCFRKFERNHKGKKLVDAANRYSIPFISAHRADDDAEMTQKVFWRMLKIKPELRDEIEMTAKKQRKWAESQNNQLQNFFKFSKKGEPFKYPDLSVYERGFPKEVFQKKIGKK